MVVIFALQSKNGLKINFTLAFKRPPRMKSTNCKPDKLFINAEPTYALTISSHRPYLGNRTPRHKQNIAEQKCY